MKKGAEKKNQWLIVKKVLRYIKKYIGLLACAIVLALGIVALTLYVPILIGYAIDGIVYGATDFREIGTQLVKIVIVVAITAGMQWTMNAINNRVTFQVVRDIREEVFGKLQVLPLSYLDTHPHGSLVSRIITDVDQFAEGLLMGFTQFFTGIMTIVGTLLFMLSINVTITCVVVLVTPISLFVANFIAKRTYNMFKLQSEARGEQTALIDEIIGNEKVVKAYNYEQQAIERFDGLSEQLATYSLQATFFSSLTNPATRFVNGLVYAGVALTGAFAVVGGTMTVGVWSAILNYANQYTKPFNEISGVMTELQNAIACAGRIFDLMEESAQKPDRVDAIVASEVTGEVCCKEVSFSYTPEKPLIEDFSLEVKPGQKVAVVGPTGCGKTTLINLLMRFYEVDAGAIYVDGIDIQDLTRQSLRAHYGMVLQETWIKRDTVSANIAMGKPSATEEEIIQAAKLAHAHAFIKRLPKGYDTMLQDEGMLSQGQKQLLCIARVMLMAPPMLILDEATSSIDTRTELQVQSAFERLMQGRTSFVVAHRLSTIQHADMILVMKEGKIIEKGTHETLLAQGGFYSELYNSQFAYVQTS